MRRLIMMALLGMSTGCMAQQVCYRSISAAAAAASGLEDTNGFRLESVRYDAFSQTGWALVRSCLHPEWPGQIVRVAGGSKRFNYGVKTVARAVAVSLPLVTAGSRVRVVKAEESVRMELTGVAQANGREGEQLAVRLLAEGDRELFVVGTVRRDGSVEMDGR